MSQSLTQHRDVGQQADADLTASSSRCCRLDRSRAGSHSAIAEV
jgi:hypothetical protein